MLIKCKLREPGGARHEIGGVVYHFVMTESGDQVAEVTNDAHAKRFLEISEGFAEVRKEEKAVASESVDAAPAVTAAPATPKKSSKRATKAE